MLMLKWCTNLLNAVFWENSPMFKAMGAIIRALKDLSQEVGHCMTLATKGSILWILLLQSRQFALEKWIFCLNSQTCIGLACKMCKHSTQWYTKGALSQLRGGRAYWKNQSQSKKCPHKLSTLTKSQKNPDKQTHITVTPIWRRNLKIHLRQQASSCSHKLWTTVKIHIESSQRIPSVHSKCFLPKVLP